jgi:hypothetical protein
MLYIDKYLQILTWVLFYAANPNKFLAFFNRHGHWIEGVKMGMQIQESTPWWRLTTLDWSTASIAYSMC